MKLFMKNNRNKLLRQLKKFWYQNPLKNTLDEWKVDNNENWEIHTKIVEIKLHSVKSKGKHYLLVEFKCLFRWNGLA